MLRDGGRKIRRTGTFAVAGRRSNQARLFFPLNTHVPVGVAGKNRQNEASLISVVHSAEAGQPVHKGSPTTIVLFALNRWPKPRG